MRERVKSYGLSTTLPTVTIDERTLAALRQPGGAGTAKVLNLGRSLIRACGDERQPYLVPIGERAEAVLEAYDDRQIGTEAALRQLERLLTEFVEASKERERTGFDPNTFGIYWLLRQADAQAPDVAAAQIDAAFRRHPGHLYDGEQRRRLKGELYKVLLGAVGKEHMVEVADRLLTLERR